LRRTPLQALAPGDVRLLIGQQIGLRTLVPKALQMLSSDALLHSEYYPGDLLSALMRVERSHWRDYPEQLNETMELARAVASREVKIADECRAFLSANGS
jgi:hypothetical protein